jgi:Mrp family chromosome partitioning ATPase
LINIVQSAEALRTVQTAPPKTNYRSARQPNLQLLLSNFQAGMQKQSEGVVLAFTSAAPEEGVSHVTESFGAELAQNSGRRTLIITAERLQSLRVADYIRMPDCCTRTNIENLWVLRTLKANVKANGNGNGNGNGKAQNHVTRLEDESEFGLDRIDALRLTFPNILIDCRSLKVSSEAALLASSVDGVVVVVEAGRTRRDEIQNVRRTLEMAQGNFLGFILNKRRYPVPRWLYKRL